MQNNSPFKIGEERFVELRSLFEPNNHARINNLVPEIQPVQPLPISNSPSRDYLDSPVLNEGSIHENSPRKHLLTPQPQTPITSNNSSNSQNSESEVHPLINSDAHNAKILASETPLPSRLSCFSGIRLTRGTRVMPFDVKKVQITSASLVFES